MHKDLTLDDILSMIAFTGLDATNQNLEPYHLVAKRRGDNGVVDIFSVFGGAAIATLHLPVVDTAETQIVEDDDDPDWVCPRKGTPPIGEVTPKYQSTFRGAVKEGETDWEAKKLGHRNFPNTAKGIHHRICGEVKIERKVLFWGMYDRNARGLRRR